MAQEIPLIIQDHRLYIDRMVWTDLIGGQSEVALTSTMHVIRDFMGRGGNFSIVSPDGSIFRCIDRKSELIELVEETNEARSGLGLPPIKG
jgi:hypothetical protein